jgi:hypothetical protein
MFRKFKTGAGGGIGSAVGIMGRLTIPGQGVAWIALWSFWVAVSRHNHPTNLRVNAVASGLLGATFAEAVSADHLWLMPRLRPSRPVAAYAATLLMVLSWPT